MGSAHGRRPLNLALQTFFSGHLARLAGSCLPVAASSGTRLHGLASACCFVPDAFRRANA